MSRNLTYEYRPYGENVEITKPSGSVFTFPILANVNNEIRRLVVRDFIEHLKEFVDWLDEPPNDWDRLFANLPGGSGPSYAETLKEKIHYAGADAIRPEVAELSVSGVCA